MLPDVPAMRTSHIENGVEPADHQVNDDTDADQAPFDEARMTAAGELGSQCTRFLRLVRRFAAQIVMQRDEGIESAAYALLAHVVCVGPQRLTALAEAVHADPSTVSRQTTALVKHGLLERRADPMDGRASLLVATEQGRKVFDDNRRLRSEMLATVLASWSLSDLDALIAAMDRMNTDFEARVDDVVRTVADSRTGGRPR